MTLGDLLRQDGAFVLLAIGAVLGFGAGMLFRSSAKEQGAGVPVKDVPASGKIAAPVPVAAAIAAAVNKYRNENV